jgi:predicted DNA-binding transcriptional regulator YafY
MISRRKTNVKTLATNLNVSTRTIQRDIQALVLKYPIKSVGGNGGGIFLHEEYNPYNNIFSQEQVSAIEEAIEIEKMHISFRKSTTAEVDENAISKDWCVEKTTYTPDKKAIKAALESGQKIEGASLAEHQNIQIK